MFASEFSSGLDEKPDKKQVTYFLVEYVFLIGQKQVMMRADVK